MIPAAYGGVIHSTLGPKIETFYWIDGNKEVDFIVGKGETTVALEVKSSQKRTSLLGLKAFSEKFHPQRELLVGRQGIPLEEFLLTYPEQYI